MDIHFAFFLIINLRYLTIENLSYRKNRIVFIKLCGCHPLDLKSSNGFALQIESTLKVIACKALCDLDIVFL